MELAVGGVDDVLLPSNVKGVHVVNDEVAVAEVCVAVEANINDDEVEVVEVVYFLVNLGLFVVDAANALYVPVVDVAIRRARFAGM